MDTETIIMELIVQAGDARSLAIEAIRAARQGEFDKADKLMEECRTSLIATHEIQTDLIRTEITGEPSMVSLLMVHAQDHVMNAMTVKDLSVEIIELMKSK